MDEDTQAPAENEQVVEDNNQPTSPVEETNTSEQSETDGEAEQAQINEPAAEETNEDAERKPTRAERRIRQLAEENRQLRTQPNQFAPAYQQPPQIEVQPGEELTVEQYQQHVAQAAQSVVAPQLETFRAEFETKEALNNFDRDMEFIEKTYDELKDNSPIADVLEKQISEEFKQKAYRLVGFDQVTGQPQYRVDPSVRLADIAAQKVADARAIAQRTSADMKNAVATLADESAVRPSGSVSSDKSFESLSIEEMEAKLGVVRQ